MRHEPIDVAPPAAEIEFAEEERPRRRRWGLALVIAVLSIAGGAGAALYATGRLPPIPLLSNAVVNKTPVVKAPRDSGKEGPAARGGAATSAPGSAAGSTATVDQRLQRSPVWQLLKRDHAAWYAEQVGIVTRLAGEGRGDADIATHLSNATIELRRQHAAHALASSPDQLRRIAGVFVETLKKLEKQSTAACYGFISQGETNPAVAQLTTSADHAALLEAQQRVIFEAIAAGKKAPAAPEAPQREDYDLLTAELGRMGWTVADLQTFSDARALARAAPAQVCKMVQDWFTAQLAIKDETVQVRLLRESLKPVVAG
jgi:hypothetical protein